MIKYIRLLALFLLISSQGSAQTMRGMYINGFDVILGNTVKEDSLLMYMQDSSYNYLALYDLSSLDFTSTAEMNLLSAFILKARQVFNIQNIGAVGETFAFFTDIANYNNSRQNQSEKFNVFNLEFEFWINASVQPGGYYCVKYLQEAGCSCDTAGAFDFYISMLRSIDSLAATQGAVSETYLGWFNAGQAGEIQPSVDRILLHAYRVDNTSVWGYSKTRLSYLAANNQVVNVSPIFSAEPDFMGPWLQNHSQCEAFNQYKADFNADNSSWKQYINLIGNQWFCWGFMPKPDPVSCTTEVPGGGFTDQISSTAAMIHWNPVALTDSIIIRYKVEASTGYSYLRMANTGQVSAQITGLLPGTEYSWCAKTVCGNISGNYSEKTLFTTSSSIGIEETSSQNLSGLAVYPLPASDKIFLALQCRKQEAAVLSISDMTGKTVLTEERILQSGTNLMEAGVSDFAKGIYFLSLKTATQNILKRIPIE